MSATEIKENHQDFHTLHQYYKDIIDCMPNIVYLLDKNCTLTGCNNNLLKLLNIKKIDEARGAIYKKFVELAHWSEERMQLLKRDDIEAILSSVPTYNVAEAPVIANDGEITYYLATRVPLMDKNKKTIGLVVILTDVSERRKMEEQLEKIKEQLQQQNAKPQNISTLATNKQKITQPNVLLIEDNSMAQKAGQALLMQLDCKVEVADSGEKVALLFEPGKYDIVFMDIGLEDTSGYVLSKKIRQMEKNSNYHVPIIALTGYEADVVKYDCNDYFMEGAITKPLTSEQAKQIIQHYIYNIDIPVIGLKTSKRH